MMDGETWRRNFRLFQRLLLQKSHGRSLHITTRPTSRLIARLTHRGCEHGCVYCFARPSHAYLGFSPGLDFETQIVSKPDAPKVLRKELQKNGYRCEVLALGSNTDPYQPIEKKLKITRQILEILLEHRHPVGIVTKSQLILRDVDLLTTFAQKNLVHVFISVTTLNSELAQRMEPRASSPERRLETIRKLHDAGVPVGALASPMIPAINDMELEKILEQAQKAGAQSAGYILVRLPLELKELFTQWLDTHYPTKTKHVLNLIRDTREGALYKSEFGKRMRGSGTYADLLRQRFQKAVVRYGLNKPLPPLDLSQFRTGAKPTSQLSLSLLITDAKE